MMLTEFLLARIAEDEAVARRAADDHYGVDGGLRFGEVGYDTLPVLTVDPGRVLAECEARRRIVEEVAYWVSQKPEDIEVPALVEVVCRPLAHLAAVYADHPDYRGEWRP